MSKYLTIDVGGTNIKYALMDEDAVIYDQGEVPTPHESLDVYLDTLESLYHKYEDQNIEAVCMSAPGRLNSNTGYFHTGGALQYIHELNLAELLKDRIPVPFAVENDAKAAALAEMWKGSMQGVKNGAVLILGTGIGGAVIIDGKLYRGTNYAAGEFSGIPVSWDSRSPGKNSWADINGVPGLMHKYAAIKRSNPNTMNGRIFFEDVNNGDPEAIAELEWFAETLCSGLYGLQLVLDVEKIAIGGGISRQSILEETVKRVQHNMYKRMPFYFPATEPEIVTCTFSSDANMVGALYHYLHELKGKEQA